MSTELQTSPANGDHFLQISYPDEHAWLNARLQGVGASEVPAILGLVGWASAFSLWSEKTQQVSRELLDTPRLRRGRKLEPLVAEEYEIATGRKLLDPGRHTVRWSKCRTCGGTGDGDPVPGDPHDCYTCRTCKGTGRGVLFATIDRVIAASDEPCSNCGKVHVGDGLLEAKSVYGFNADQWDEEAPLAPQVQLQTQLGVSGIGWGVVAAWIGLEDFRFYCVDADPELYALLSREAERFWQCVVEGVPPSIDGSEPTTAALRKMHPDDTGETVEIPPEALADAVALEQAQAELKRWKAIESESKNRLRHHIGRATFGVLGDRTYTLKTVKKAGYTVKEQKYRELRRKTK